MTLLFSVAVAFAAWWVLRHTDLGKALRASAEDAPIAAAFGINQRRNSFLLAGTCAALAGVAGVCIALSSSISPSQDVTPGWVLCSRPSCWAGWAARWGRWWRASSSA